MMLRNSSKAYWVALLVTSCLTTATIAQETAVGASPSGSHPLAKILTYAKAQHEYVQKNVRDYTCIIVKRESIDGEMQDYQFMAVKARMARFDGQQKLPFAVHITYAKPARVAGRAVEYIEGENDNKMLVRLRKGGFTFRINLDSPRAMEESTIPITDLSFDKMLSDAVAQLQTIMKADPQGENTEADIVKGAKINDRPSTLIYVRHPNRGDGLDFYEARMFVDDRWGMPTRLEVYDWPAEPGGQPSLIGEFTYLNLEVNVGIPDSEFRTIYVPGQATNAEVGIGSTPR